MPHTVVIVCDPASPGSGLGQMPMTACAIVVGAKIIELHGASFRLRQRVIALVSHGI